MGWSCGARGGGALGDTLPKEEHLGLFPKEKLAVLKLQRKSTPDPGVHTELGLSIDLISKPAKHGCGQRSEPQLSEEWKGA